MLLSKCPSLASFGELTRDGEDLKTGADWLENHRGHGRRLRAPNQSAYRSTATTPRNYRRRLLRRRGKGVNQAQSCRRLIAGKSSVVVPEDLVVGRIGPNFKSGYQGL
jgi:hypothetical protein